MSIFKQPLIQNPPPNLQRKTSYTNNKDNYEVDDDDDDDNDNDDDDGDY